MGKVLSLLLAFTVQWDNPSQFTDGTGIPQGTAIYSLVRWGSCDPIEGDRMYWVWGEGGTFGRTFYIPSLNPGYTCIKVRSAIDPYESSRWSEPAYVYVEQPPCSGCHA